MRFPLLLCMFNIKYIYNINLFITTCISINCVGGNLFLFKRTIYT